MSLVQADEVRSPDFCYLLYFFIFRDQNYVGTWVTPPLKLVEQLSKEILSNVLLFTELSIVRNVLKTQSNKNIKANLNTIFIWDKVTFNFLDLRTFFHFICRLQDQLWNRFFWNAVGTVFIVVTVYFPELSPKQQRALSQRTPPNPYGSAAPCSGFPRPGISHSAL